MKIAVIGLGIQGYACAYDLAGSVPVEEMRLYDPQPGVAAAAAKKLRSPKVRVLPHTLKGAPLAKTLKGVDAVACTSPYYFIPDYTRMAIGIGAHFSDLGGHYQTVEAQLRMDAAAKRAGVAVLPDCGLAPGLAGIIAWHYAQGFDRPAESLRIRVGGLPQKPKGLLQYAKFFSPYGLLNEYWNDCVVVRNDKKERREGMTEIESLRFKGLPPLEAFHTSGGISTLPLSLRGRVRNMDYKTIRYPGHCEKFRAFQELGLDAEFVELDGRKVHLRRLLVESIARALPEDRRDMVLMRIDIEGKVKGKRRRRRIELIDRYDARSGLTAMQRTTAFTLSCAVQQASDGTVKMRGAMPAETALDAPKMMRYLAERGFGFSIT
jgi:lysine 6-dehydrogenase